ncbi:MAG: hypothetical protein J5786_04415, partial [Clostridiales bacterium]|nr:hypothetical protein [Clostridiales bacterium]
GETRKIKFNHNPGTADDIETGLYTNTVYSVGETTIMNLGHGRAGHLPDYSFISYKYMPAWDNYRECLKDNPSEYFKAFCQMIYAMKFLRGDIVSFEKKTYDEDSVAPFKHRINEILTKRQPDSSADWKAFGEELSGKTVPDFDESKYVEEYMKAGKKDNDDTFLGRFILAALAQKSMVTHSIFKSGNMLAGFSIEYGKRGFKGLRDYRKLVESKAEGKDG